MFIYSAAGIGGGAVLTFLFFRRMDVFLILGPIGALYPAVMRSRIERKRKEKFLTQWKEAMDSLSVSLGAGYSVENALRQTEKDMEQRYGAEQMITREFNRMAHQIDMNMPAEKVMESFAVRSGLDEVRNFAEIFRIGKRSGADLVRMTAEAAEVIGSRVEGKEEIVTLMTGVRIEGNIMNIVPLAILAYINFTSPQFFEVMYQTLFGQMIMAAGMVCYLAICGYTIKLMDVEL